MKNRKKTDTYRFNGVWGMKPVKIAQLEEWIEEYEAKLTDANHRDDKKWVAHWLKRFRQELRKKQKGKELKRREKA
jgi:hypothetical protein